MLIHIDEKTTLDTEHDLSTAERHIVQKLLCYKLIVASIDEFKTRTQQALTKGWNNSGPIPPSREVSRLIAYLEEKIKRRLQQESDDA